MVRLRRRGKLQVQYIKDRKEREKTVEKRLPTLLKKTSEFTVLCDVLTCLVVYLPGEDQPVIWPSRDGAVDVLRRLGEMEDSQKLKHKLDGAEFIGKLMEKTKAELSTIQRQCRDMENNHLIVDFLAGRRGSLDDLSPEALAAFGWKVGDKLSTVYARLQELHGGAPPLPPSPPSLQTPIVPGDGSGLSTTEELDAFIAKAGIFTSPPGPSFSDHM